VYDIVESHDDCACVLSEQNVKIANQNAVTIK